MRSHHFIGTWRSYKAFYASGCVKKHTPTSYLEVTVDEDHCMTIKQAPAPVPREALVQTSAWEIKEVKKKNYLFIQGKQAYEVITLEPDDLVLADMAKGEKLFFAQLPEWRNRMYEPVVSAEQDVSITIWSKSLIELIQE
ncbi:hypothetical protein [Flavisolibacter tropicus]|uniref:Lipocalin-like domain-containing protein n=1 Tax=Flavisolibacter tropicus TaxID=1492898 RepID=A0A172TWS4_9BACT|nr:hypothetical protein [Flavisolibacter tropicus]ANE51432.1 hypothetical protein SY85_13880 [Flavisolibacter tropicus]